MTQMSPIDDLVARCRPDVTPDPAVMAHHRAQLHDRQSRIDGDRTPPASSTSLHRLDGERPGRHAMRRPRVLVGVAAAGLIVVASAAIVALRNGDHAAAPGTLPPTALLGPTPSALIGPSTTSGASPTSALAISPPTTVATAVTRTTVDRAAEELAGLLYPADDTMTVVGATATPMPPGRRATTLVKSSGELTSVTANENFWGNTAPDWDRRDIGDQTVWSGNEDGNTVYAVVNDCSLIAIDDGNSSPWRPEVNDLLEGLSVDGADASLVLPEGWHDLGAGELTTLYELTLTVTVNGDPFDVQLIQMPNTSLGAVATQHRFDTAESISVNGHDGWLFQSSDAHYIGWPTETGAALLGGPTVLDQDQLEEIAALLMPDRPDDWADQLGQSREAAATATTALIVGAGGTGSSACPAPSLTILPR